MNNTSFATTEPEGEQWRSDWKELNTSGVNALYQADFVHAENFLSAALALVENEESRQIEFSTSLVNFGSLYQQQGKFTEAESQYLRAKVIREKLFGQDHPMFGQCLNNLATLYDEQGKYDEAETLYLKALKIDEKNLGPNHIDVAKDLNNLAVLYRMQARYSNAEALYQRVIAIVQQSPDANPLEVAAFLNNLALVYSKQNKLAEAESLYLQSIEIIEEWPDLRIPILQKLCTTSHASTNCKATLPRPRHSPFAH